MCLLKEQNEELKRQVSGSSIKSNLVQMSLEKTATVQTHAHQTSRQHIEYLQDTNESYTTSKAIWCKVFPISLKEEALNWFTQLPPNSMDSFKALATKFSTQYDTSRPHNKSFLALFNVRQEKGEPLRTFMERFSKLSEHHKSYARNSHASFDFGS